MLNLFYFLKGTGTESQIRVAEYLNDFISQFEFRLERTKTAV